MTTMVTTADDGDNDDGAGDGAMGSGAKGFDDDDESMANSDI